MEELTLPNGKIVRNWASILEPGVLLQAEAISNSPYVTDPVALMPDAHVGIDAIVGSAVLMRGGVIPSIIGTDIGCGVSGITVSMSRYDFTPEKRQRILAALTRTIPAGVGIEHPTPLNLDDLLIPRMTPRAETLVETMRRQYGTLGAGNHFVEVSYDEDIGYIWFLVHSGSRGVGAQLANYYIKEAKRRWPAKESWLSAIPEEDPLFQEYLADCKFATAFAYASRQAMLAQVIKAMNLEYAMTISETVNCIHNFIEPYDGGYLARKGAVKAELNDDIFIPGSMGGLTYRCYGLGNELSYNTGPHGAGRVLSRTAARKTLSVAEFTSQMAKTETTWQADAAEKLIDEAPDAYKSPRQVMLDSAELCKNFTKMNALVNYKGV